MDSLAAISPFIGIFRSVIQIGIALKTYYHRVRKARDDIDRLYKSLTSLESFLTQVQDSTKSNKTILSNLNPSLESELTPVKFLQAELKKLDKKLDVTEVKGKFERAYQRLKWPFNKMIWTRYWPISRNTSQASILNLILRSCKSIMFLYSFRLRISGISEISSVGEKPMNFGQQFTSDPVHSTRIKTRNCLRCLNLTSKTYVVLITSFPPVILTEADLVRASEVFKQSIPASLNPSKITSAKLSFKKNIGM